MQPALRLLELQFGGENVLRRLEAQVGRQRAGAVLPVDGKLRRKRFLRQCRRAGRRQLPPRTPMHRRGERRLAAARWCR